MPSSSGSDSLKTQKLDHDSFVAFDHAAAGQYVSFYIPFHFILHFTNPPVLLLHIVMVFVALLPAR